MTLDILKANILSRIEQYGLNEAIFIEWCQKFTGPGSGFSGPGDSNRYEYLLPQLFRAEIEMVSVCPVEDVCEVLGVDFASDESISDIRKEFPNLHNPIDLRFAAVAQQMAEIGCWLGSLLIDPGEDIVHIGYSKDITEDILFETVQNDVKCKVGIIQFTPEYEPNIEDTTKRMQDRGKRFALYDDITISPLMVDKIGWLALKAGQAESINSGRVREIMRMK